MARKTKKAVIESLKKWGVEFDPETKYDDLVELLKKAEATPEGSIAQGIHLDRGFSKENIKAARKVGFSFEQIKSFGTEDDLCYAINRVKPNISTYDQTTTPKAKEPKAVKTLKLDLKIIPSMAKSARVEHEQRAIGNFKSRNGLNGIKRIVTKEIITRYYEPMPDHKYLTEVSISYKERKQ